MIVFFGKLEENNSSQMADSSNLKQLNMELISRIKASDQKLSETSAFYEAQLAELNQKLGS